MCEVEKVVLLKMNGAYLSPEASIQQDFIIDPLWQNLFEERVMVALAEKEIKYETKEEDYASPKSSLLLEMNPLYKQVPVLIHNGKPIIQSLIIVEYIDETWSGQGPNLLPSNPYERSHARIWADYVDKKFHATAGKLLKNKDQTKEEREEIGKELSELFKKLEEELVEKDYFGGRTFGFLDIAILPFISMFPIFEFLTKLKLEDQCPKIYQWADRCAERETVSNSVLDQVFALSIVVTRIITDDGRK